MDAFEAVVGEILHREGYWVQSPYRVGLTKAEKVEIGRPSCPRWELDIVAYKASLNRILMVECKSYLDSYGVRYSGFDGSNSKEADRYKIFNEDTLRRVVTNRMVREMCDAGLAREDPDVRLVLACGKIKSVGDHERLRAHFHERGWMLWDKEWFKQKLIEMSVAGYENSAVALTVKLLLRDGP